MHTHIYDPLEEHKHRLDVSIISMKLFIVMDCEYNYHTIRYVCLCMTIGKYIHSLAFHATRTLTLLVLYHNIWGLCSWNIMFRHFKYRFMFFSFTKELLLQVSVGSHMVVFFN